VKYRIDVEQPARKEIKDLPGYVRAQATALIDALADDPRPPRAKELLGKPNIYRLWLAGRWRIIYEISEDAKVISILRVRRKERIDYESLEPPE
jgi:mRNA interferase RelE/StbE